MFNVKNFVAQNITIYLRRNRSIFKRNILAFGIMLDKIMNLLMFRGPKKFISAKTLLFHKSTF